MIRSTPFLSIGGLYIAQAIPLYLVAAALPPILRARGADLSLIGSLGVLMAPWALKFLWAPLVDRYASRKRWILATQSVTLAIIMIIANLDPVADITLFFPLLMAMSISAATQDIAADGYTVEHLAPGAQANGGAIQGGAVAAGVLLGGSLTLFVNDVAGWTVAVTCAAVLSALATLPFLICDESVGLRPDTPARRRATFRHFWQRAEMRRLLIFALIFRLPEGLVKTVEQAFFVDLGFSLTKIGLISGGAAACVGLAGSACGAWALRHMGLGGFLQAIIILRTLCFGGYAFCAHYGGSDGVLIALSALNTFARYMEIVGLYSAFTRFSSLSQAGTDFTILASAMLLTYMLGALAAGLLASSFGYGVLFTTAAVLSALAGIASLRSAPNLSLQTPTEILR